VLGFVFVPIRDVGCMLTRSYVVKEAENGFERERRAVSETGHFFPSQSELYFARGGLMSVMVLTAWM